MGAGGALGRLAIRVGDGGFRADQGRAEAGGRFAVGRHGVKTARSLQHRQQARLLADQRRVGRRFPRRVSGSPRPLSMPRSVEGFVVLKSPEVGCVDVTQVRLCTYGGSWHY
ncbi:hypothetical protein GCM10027615_11980 [Plantactinospora veratri]